MVDDGNSESNVPVARCAVERQTGYADPLASQRLPAVLALEIQAHGKTAFAKDLQQLIRQMAADNATWGEERIANELKLNSGLKYRHAPWESTCAPVAQCARQIQNNVG